MATNRTRTAQQSTTASTNVADADKARNAESKYARFERLANMRVNKALKQIQLVGNLANRSSYAYTTDQAAKVMAALDAAVQQVGSRFTQSGTDDDKFTL